MKVFVDTSALYALLDPDDANHTQASSQFRALEGHELITHNYIHLEADALVRKRLGREAALDLAESILPAIRTVWIDEATHGQAIEAMSAGGGSLVDHVSFVVMRREGFDTALAFDRDFDAQGFRRPSRTSDDRSRRLSEGAAPYGGADPAGDLVSVAEVAARSGRTVNTVQSWRRRHRTFPQPIAQLAAGPIWKWDEVALWIDRRPPAR